MSNKNLQGQIRFIYKLGLKDGIVRTAIFFATAILIYFLWLK